MEDDIINEALYASFKLGDEKALVFRTGNIDKENVSRLLSDHFSQMTRRLFPNPKSLMSSEFTEDSIKELEIMYSAYYPNIKIEIE